MSIYYTVYETTNLINKKIYIGVHKTTDPYDSYLGSGKNIQDAVNKYGQKNFEKKILFKYEVLNEESEERAKTLAYNKEREIVTWSFVKRRDTYNIKPGGFGGTTFNSETISDSSRKKCAIAGKKSIMSPSGREKLSNERTGKGNPMYGKVPWNKNKTGYSTSKKGQKRKWITNGTICKQVLREDPIPDGWRKGRLVTWNTRPSGD